MDNDGVASELPSGTVSLLFSDVEGSTVLLSRLGADYVHALDGQRQVLRRAWAAHEGRELGTEGDSFFVVFPTADGAVKAAAQAQRELAEYPWPGGEQVRVRIGIHTGSPQVHGGGYVGMDVHRAARIASAAHGGQVVMSSVTAALARGGLPEGVGVRDHGSHQLKDIAAAENLVQLTIDGLEADFPPLRAIGAGSSLPLPPTRLVGRDGEVDELTTLLRLPEVRLLTLTGPGGSGKTRLAIAVAQRLVSDFPDGVFFVPLAAVRTADLMWASMAEVLDVPERGRTPPGVRTYVAHRCALLVLDNLEQLSGAGDEVAELLAVAPQVAVIASSRRALSVAGEQLHPVPPLTLPGDSTLTAANESGAVQLFVQQARSIRPDFSLTEGNAAEVVAICRKLDGLPLAIELSAARMRLLSPTALLSRLDQALDIASISTRGPSRQRTLRDTIAWSYDLLTPAQQAFFRHLGVFSGGADLDAIAAVTDDGADCLDRVADLVDASLIQITEGPDGEPRIAMLDTIRAYARDQLRSTGEADVIRSAHAEHFLRVAERLRFLLESQNLAVRGLAQLESDNFRDALAWTLQESTGRPTVGLRLASALGWWWWMGGQLVEGRRWYERAIERAGDSPSEELAACLRGLANLLLSQGNVERARDLSTSSLTMARTLGDDEGVAAALGLLGTAQQWVGDIDGARQTLQEALLVRRQLDNPGRLARALGHLAGIEEQLEHFDTAEALTQESLRIFRDLGDEHEIASHGQNLANLLATAGRAEEARRVAEGLVESVLTLQSPHLTLAFADTYLNILIRVGETVPAAHLFGAEEAMRERYGIPNPHHQEELAEIRTLIRELISVDDWERHCQVGRGETVEHLLARVGSG